MMNNLLLVCNTICYKNRCLAVVVIIFVHGNYIQRLYTETFRLCYHTQRPVSFYFVRSVSKSEKKTISFQSHECNIEIPSIKIL